MPADDPQILASREAEVGGIPVRRALPQRNHRTVGAWCFADHIGPSASGVATIGPHPHIGLQTVTWVLEGELVHRDSVGSEQAIRPGQLNLMTAGGGVVHAEDPEPGPPQRGHAVQLWVAQPEATRRGAPDFEHHAELPPVELDDATATVLVGSFAGTSSPARADTDHFGTQLLLRGRTTVPIAAGAEHAVIALDGPVALDGRALPVGHVAYLAPGRTDLHLATTEPRRVLLLGGTPFPDEIHMWWNFVAASRDEITEAYRDWEAGNDRFPHVGSVLDRVPAPRPPWLARP